MTLRNSFRIFFVVLLILCNKVAFAADNEEPSDAAASYLEAMDHFSNYSYTAALTSFAKLEQYFPGDPLVRKALVMRIFIHYLLSQRESVPELVGNFLKLYPNDEYTPYVHYMNALTGYVKLYVPGKGSESSIEKVQQDFAFIVQHYPGTVYATYSARRLQFLANFKAMYRLRVAEQYQSSGYIFSAIRRYNQLLKLRDHDFRPIVIARLAESYASLGMEEHAQRYKLMLRREFPDFPNSIRFRYIAGAGNVVSDGLGDDVNFLLRRIKVFK